MVGILIPEAASFGMIVGIDLGTTNSLIGVWEEGTAKLIPNALGDVLTPSAIGIADDGQLLVGRAARERLTTHPTLSATAFKRYMGTSSEIALGDRSFRPEELSALLLKTLKADAELHLGEPIEEAIITVPAYFNDAQRKATKIAGEMAGFKVRRLLTEPTAAALAYGLDHPSEDEKILVIDLGGGTFDVSLLHVFDGVTEVRATAGDSWLGGEDFVDVIVAAFMSAVGTKAGVDTSHTSVIHASLRRQAEVAKRKLSEAQSATLQIPHQDQMLKYELTRTEFEERSERLLLRLRLPIERALRDARLEPDSIGQVILAGGATRMPMIRKLISRLFRRLPLQTIHPDEVVGRGAAVRSGMLMRDSDLIERVMTDVSPFTLGIEVCEFVDGDATSGLFAPIIERNTVVPASRIKYFNNVHDMQAEIRVDVYQGESLFVTENMKIGSLSVPIPAGPAGSQSVGVRFTYDTSGLLEVETVVETTGVRRTLVIEGSLGLLTSEEIAERLAGLAGIKMHPRDQAENQVVLARCKRLYEEYLGLDRDRIGGALLVFQAALDSQNPDRIQTARMTLEGFVAQFDDGAFS